MAGGDQEILQNNTLDRGGNRGTRSLLLEQVRCGGSPEKNDGEVTPFHTHLHSPPPTHTHPTRHVCVSVLMRVFVCVRAA